jgi:hypothetical protein
MRVSGWCFGISRFGLVKAALSLYLVHLSEISGDASSLVS